MVGRVEGLPVAAEFDHGISFHVLVSKKKYLTTNNKKRPSFGPIHKPRTLMQMKRKLPAWEMYTIFTLTLSPQAM